MPTTARGTFVVKVFVQEDRIITPAMRETMLINPVILGEENANTIYQASRAGEAGLLLDTILAALQAGSLAVAIVLDIADSALSNKRSFRIFEARFNVFPRRYRNDCSFDSAVAMSTCCTPLRRAA